MKAVLLDCFPLSQVKVGIFGFSAGCGGLLLAPTASGDGAGARGKSSFFFRGPLFFRGPQEEVTVESGGKFEDYIRFLSCHLFSPVNHGQAWKG
jgi:hypothetical protein